MSNYVTRYHIAFFPHGLLEVGKTRKSPYQYIILLIHSLINIMVWTMILQTMLQNFCLPVYYKKYKYYDIKNCNSVCFLYCVKLGLSH
jgi:hypothetical protein